MVIESGIIWKSRSIKVITIKLEIKANRKGMYQPRPIFQIVNIYIRAFRDSTRG